MKSYKFFLFIFAYDLIITPFYKFLSQSGLNYFSQLFKITFLVLFLNIMYHIVTKNKINISKESLLFVFFTPIAIIIGVIKYPFNRFMISHLVFSIMPILGLSFGIDLKENYLDSDEFKLSFNKLIKVVFVLNIVLVFAYRIFNYLKIIRYPAIGLMGLFFTSIYYLYKRKYFIFLLGVAAIVISGKRAILVITLATMIFHMFIENKYSILMFLKNIWTLLIVSVLGYYIYIKTNFLDRFFLTISKFDLNNLSDLNIATGGRSNEVINIIEFLNDSSINWVLGSGIGTRVEVHENFFRHYSHFTFLGYTMIFGIFFSVILYVFFVYDLMKSKNTSIVYYFKLCFFGFLVQSVFGATPMVDLKFWIILGILISYNKVYKLKFIKKRNISKKNI